MPRMIAAIRTLAAALTLLSVPVSSAFAHAVLINSTPAIDGKAAAGQTHIVLRYNSRVDHGRSLLLLTRPDQSQARLPVAASSAADALETDTKLDQAGAYNIRWQVLAVDGHITRGDVPFTVPVPSTQPPATKN